MDDFDTIRRKKSEIKEIFIKHKGNLKLLDKTIGIAKNDNSINKNLFMAEKFITNNLNLISNNYVKVESESPDKNYIISNIVSKNENKIFTRKIPIQITMTKYMLSYIFGRGSKNEGYDFLKSCTENIKKKLDLSYLLGIINDFENKDGKESSPNFNNNQREYHKLQTNKDVFTEMDNSKLRNSKN